MKLELARKLLRLNPGEHPVEVCDIRTMRSIDIYAVPQGTDNPQDAVKYRRVAYWSQDKDYGEWIFTDGEPTGITERDIVTYIGIAR